MEREDGGGGDVKGAGEEGGALNQYCQQDEGRTQEEEAGEEVAGQEVTASAPRNATLLIILLVSCGGELGVAKWYQGVPEHIEK